MSAEPPRIQLWRKMFSRQVPLSKDIDFPFLARQFAIAEAIFPASRWTPPLSPHRTDASPQMGLVVQALARQMAKQGRVATATEFKQYYKLVGQANSEAAC
jgi:hypothetical protein